MKGNLQTRVLNGLSLQIQKALAADPYAPAKDAKAQDGILSSPLLAMAALLYLLGKFHDERVSPQDYDLRTYQPKRKIF